MKKINNVVKDWRVPKVKEPIGLATKFFTKAPTQKKRKVRKG